MSSGSVRLSTVVFRLGQAQYSWLRLGQAQYSWLRLVQAQYSWLRLGQTQYSCIQFRPGILHMSSGSVRLSTVGFRLGQAFYTCL
jgi:hypothetical protein